MFLFGKKKKRVAREEEDRKKLIKQILDEVKKTTQVREDLEKRLADLDNVSKKVRIFETKLADLSNRVNRLERTLSETNSKIDKLAKNIEQLLSLYELAVSKANPFTEELKLEEIKEEKEMPKVTSKEEDLEKRVEEIVNKNIEKFSKELEKEASKEGLEQAKEAEIFFGEEKVSKIIPLTKINRDYKSITTALTWLGYLVERLGIDGTLNLLRFYVDIGWINKDVLIELVKLVKGIKRTSTSQPLEKPELRDHLISIYFIAKLKGINIGEEYEKMIMDFFKSEDLKEILRYKYPGEE